MRIRTTDCCLIRKGSGIVMTQEQSNQNECQILIYSVQDFLARHSLSPESEKDSRSSHWSIRACEEREKFPITKSGRVSLGRYQS